VRRGAGPSTGPTCGSWSRRRQRRKGGIGATIGLDLAQCTRAGLRVRAATGNDANAAGGLACDHPHVSISETVDEGGDGATNPRGYFKHVRWSEDTDAPVLIVAYGSAPGVPNWGGLLKKLRRDLLVRGKNCAGGAGAEAAAAVDAAAAGYDVLYVADTTRSWYHGEARCTNDATERAWRERVTAVAGRYARVLNLGDSMGAERGASLRRRRGPLPRVLPPG
jgi:hypothetical protein